jgi:hypothetical protein
MPVSGEVVDLSDLSEDEACAFIELVKHGREAIEAVERRKKESLNLSGLRVTMTVSYEVQRSPYDAH